MKLLATGVAIAAVATAAHAADVHPFEEPAVTGETAFLETFSAGIGSWIASADQKYNGACCPAIAREPAPASAADIPRASTVPPWNVSAASSRRPIPRPPRSRLPARVRTMTDRVPRPLPPPFRRPHRRRGGQDRG